MPLVAGLEDILRPEVLVHTTGDVVELTEKAKGGADMRVEIVGLPAIVIAIRMTNVGRHDKRGSLAGVGHATSLRDGEWKQICDYLLAVEASERIQVVFVELKTTYSEEDKPGEQLRRSLPLLKYLQSILEIQWGTQLDERSIAIHYSVLFKQTSSRLAKQSVKAGPIKPKSKWIYKGMTIRNFIGRRIPFSSLTGE